MGFSGFGGGAGGFLTPWTQDLGGGGGLLAWLGHSCIIFTQIVQNWLEIQTLKNIIRIWMISLSSFSRNRGLIRLKPRQKELRWIESRI